MSDRIVEAKNDTDEEPEEGEIQDDGFEDVSSDDEISSITRREESVMYSHSFVLHKVSKVKGQSLCSPRSDIRFHVPEKLDHISQTSQKRSRTGLRPVEHDYYEMFHRYNKTFKDHHSKGRIHEKENKAREIKKLYKKSSLHNTIIESRSMYGGDRSEGRYSSTSSKGSWHQCEVKEKHKKKKKSKSNKSYPLVEVHESQMISSKDLKVSEECLKTTMNVKEDKVCENGDVKQDKSKLGEVQSPTSSDIEILDVPKKVPEVITIGDSDDDGQLQNLNKDDAKFEVSGNPSSEVDYCNEPTEPDKKSEYAGSATESDKKAEDSGGADSTEVDENLELLREAALNSSKTEQTLHSNPDYEVLQLRLAALRSAIIRKFEERKKRGITLTKKGRNAEGKHAMSISPLSSPNHCSSGESYVPVSEETDMYLPSGEYIGQCGSTDVQNESEIDKITAIDMELVESDEEKEHVSIPSEDATSENITPQFTDDNNVTNDDSSMKNSSERRSLDDISKEILPNSVLQSVSASQSPIMHTGEFHTVGTEEATSGYAIGNSEKPSNLVRERHMQCVPVYFNSQLLPCDNNHSLDDDEQNKTQQPDYDYCGSHKTENNFVQEKVLEDVNNIGESSCHAGSPVTSVEAYKLGHNDSKKESNANLLIKDVNDSEDSCSSADLDLGSMIVLDEVGKCSDDNKSEGSLMDVVSGTEHQLSCHSSEGHANQGSYKVNSFKVYVRNTNVGRHVRQRSENVNLNSETREKYSKPVIDHSDEVKSSDIPFSQRSVNQNNLINCVESRGNVQQFHERCISINSDSHDNPNCIKESRICDKTLVKDSNCKNCNSNLSNQCTCNAVGEAFKDEQFSKEDKTKSNLSELSGVTSVELPDTFRPLLVNSNDQNVNNTDHSSIKNTTLNFPMKDVEILELGSKDKEETIPDEFLSVSEKFTELVTDNETCDSIIIKSTSQFPVIGVNEKDSHSVRKQVEECGDKNNSPTPNNIFVEEDEEVLRLSLLAMLDKKSKDVISKNLLPSPQNIEAKENILSHTNVGCDSGHAENIVLEHRTMKVSLPPPNTVSSYKSTKVNVPIKPLLPSKSSCVNPKVYPHHKSLTHTKPVFPSRNKLTSVNKRGAKSNKNRMIKSNSSGRRSNINVPQLVINLGEDSDSGEDANELHAVKERSNASTEFVDHQSATQVVPPDFAKKLDLLLKQARFEQEGVSSEERDDSGDNDQVEPTKYVNVSSVSTEEISKSLGGAIENSSVSGHSTLDIPVGNAPGVSASLANETNNSAITCDNTASAKENVSTFNRGDTCKISLPTNVKKNITPDGKKKSATNILMSSVVDIGLLPSCKQKEYLRLKRQLAQFAQRVEAKCKENREIKNILGNANNKEDTTLQTLVRRNVIKNNFGANIDRTIITRKLIRKMSVSSQTPRNELVKSRKLVKTVPNVNSPQSQEPVRLPSTSLNKVVPQPLCSPGRKVPLQQKKVTNASVCGKKSTAVPFTSTVKQKKSPTLISRFSTGKSGELREVPRNNFVIKSSQQRREIGPVSVANSCVPDERSVSLKRKKSISESSCVPVRKKCHLKLQTSTIPTCDQGENLKNKVPNSIDANEAPEHTSRALAEELWVSENKLMAKRYQVLEDLASVRVHLNEIERVSIMKQQILLDIKILREKILFSESQLSQKDELLSTLYSEVEDGKRNIMRGQSETLLLSVECEEKGCKIHGPDYSVPNTCTDMIRSGMLSISKTLQNLKEGKGSIESICEMSQFGSSEDNGQRVGGSVDNANDEENKQVQHSYSSPLDAIRTESGSDIQTFLCPYYIMGSCKDKECSYLH